MNRSRRADRAALSRRRFLKLAAAGAAAIAVPQAASAAAAPAKAASRPRPRVPAAPGRRVASAKEIEKLKGYTADSLRAVRKYPLPPGSDMAFVFRPLRAGRGRKER